MNQSSPGKIIDRPLQSTVLENRTLPPPDFDLSAITGPNENLSNDSGGVILNQMLDENTFTKPRNVSQLLDVSDPDEEERSCCSWGHYPLTRGGLEAREDWRAMSADPHYPAV